MNSILPSAISRLARASAQVAELSRLPAAKAVTDSHRNSGHFSRKWSEDQFLGIFLDRPMRNCDVIQRAGEMLGMPGSTAARFLRAAVSNRRVLFHIEPGSTFGVYSLAPDGRRKTIAARRVPADPSVSGMPKKKTSPKELVEVTVMLTAQQQRELSLFAGAVGATLPDALFILAAVRFEQVCGAGIEWSDELSIFDERFRLYIDRRASLLCDYKKPVGEEKTRLELLRRFERTARN